MSPLPAEIGTAAALFAGTNVDDLLVLAVLSASAQAATPELASPLRRWQLWGGQYVGFALLTGASLAAGRGLAVIPEHWLWLLALIPLGLGAARLTAAFRSRRHGEQPAASSSALGLGGVAALTLVNGADNLAVYTPFFAAGNAGRIAVTLVVFAGGVALWCLAGWLLVGHPWVTLAVRRYGHWIMPAAFISVGLYLLQETGAFARL